MDKNFSVKKSSNGLYILNFYNYNSEDNKSTDETMVFNTIEEVLGYIKDRI